MTTALATRPVKANEWLLSNGFIQAITRGRRSTENNIRLHEAWLSGIRFTDWEPKESTDSKGDYATVNAKPVQAATNVVSDVTLRFSARDFQATAMVNGKPVDVGMGEICHNCQETIKNETGDRITLSLVGHLCESPSVKTAKGALGKVTPVKIESRTRPLPLYPWS